MLKKEQKVDTKLIPVVSKKGKRLPANGFDIRIWYDDKLSVPKFAIAVSIKVDKRAVVRNRIRRLFKAAFIDLTKENALKDANYFFIIRDAKIAELKMDDVKLRIVEQLRH